MPTPAEVISIYKLASVYASQDISNGQIFGKRINTKLPLVLQMEGGILEWLYVQDPADSRLVKIANYVFALCEMYGLTAFATITGGGGTVIPGMPIIPSIPYLIQITGASFANATDYNDSRIVGKNLVIFWSGISNPLSNPSQFVNTSTGFRITIDGVDIKNGAPESIFEIFILN